MWLVLVQATTILTATLGKARNSNIVDDTLLKEYHEALELLETSLYPDVRKRYLKASQKNLVSIIANEDKYFKVIDTAKKGGDLSVLCDNSSTSSISEDNVKQFKNDLELGVEEEKVIID